MIDDPSPDDWRDLQDGVCRLLNEVGISARTEVSIETPRGTVKVDVLAIDEGSVDRIRYLVECKNWNNSVPQSVVHAFTSVMHETGANIGYIISKHGLQSGATQYTESTNIVGMTYAELQARYFPIWWKKVFCKALAGAGGVLFEYVARSAPVPPELEEKLSALRAKYMWLATVTGAMKASQASGFEIFPPPSNMKELEGKAWGAIAPTPDSSIRYFRPLLIELLRRVEAATKEFDELLGRRRADEA